VIGFVQILQNFKHYEHLIFFKVFKYIFYVIKNYDPMMNLYIEEALKDLREENIGGIKIGGILVQML